jgi:hypothetical protein
VDLSRVDRHHLSAHQQPSPHLDVLSKQHQIKETMTRSSSSGSSRRQGYPVPPRSETRCPLARLPSAAHKILQAR